MTNLTNAIISGLLFGAAHGMVVPAHSYPNIVEPETIHCKQITETVLECDRYQMSGGFIETYYMDMFTEEVTFIDPIEPEIVEPVIEEEPIIVEPILNPELYENIPPAPEYTEPATISDPLLNDKF
jgi:hypothetical protein